jgi:hypothetical protein
MATTARRHRIQRPSSDDPRGHFADGSRPNRARFLRRATRSRRLREAWHAYVKRDPVRSGPDVPRPPRDCVAISPRIPPASEPMAREQTQVPMRPTASSLKVSYRVSPIAQGSPIEEPHEAPGRREDDRLEAITGHSDHSCAGHRYRSGALGRNSPQLTSSCEEGRWSDPCSIHRCRGRRDRQGLANRPSRSVGSAGDRPATGRPNLGPGPEPAGGGWGLTRPTRRAGPGPPR